MILVEDSDTRGPSLVTVRVEFLFANQFWYWQLCVKNLGRGERKHYFVNFFLRVYFQCWWVRVGRSVLYRSLWLQIPCTYSLRTLHIYSTSNWRRIWSPVEHLPFCGNSERIKAIGYFRRRAPSCNLWQVIWQGFKWDLVHNLL